MIQRLCRQYHCVELWHLLSNLNRLVVISNSIHAVKLCSKQILIIHLGCCLRQVVYECVTVCVCAEFGNTQEYMSELMELFKKAFAEIQDKLVDNIDVESGLWTKLMAKNVLSGRHIRTCQPRVYRSVIHFSINENVSYYYLC